MRIITPKANDKAYLSAAHDDHGLLFVMYADPSGPFMDWDTFEFLLSIYIIDKCTESQKETYVDAFNMCPLYHMGEIGALGFHTTLDIGKICNYFLIDVNEKIEMLTNIEIARP